jgi:hypothetical protein
MFNTVTDGQQMSAPTKEQEGPLSFSYNTPFRPYTETVESFPFCYVFFLWDP